MILNTKKPLKAIINIAVRGSYILYFCQVQSTNSGFVDSAKKTGEIVEGLINNPKKTISGGVNKAQSLIVNAPEIAKEGFNQLEDASALSNAKLNLYDMQQDAEAKAKYKANIAGQIAGGGGVGSIGKNVVKKGGNIIDNVANEIGKGLDGMSPKPATVVGTPDTGGATTITGKPDGTKNGIGAAETGGAILAIGDAKEGAYTNNSGGSITGPGNGRATSTNKHSSTDRAKNTVSNADQPLEPVNSNKANKGHGHDEHGYQVTPVQQETRIETGIKPSGTRGAPTGKASNFLTPELEAEALGRGRNELNNSIEKNNIPNYDINGEPNRHAVVVDTNNTNGFGERWVRAKDTNGNNIRDSNGNFVPVKDPTILKQAKIIYEYVPSKNTWEPVTYYPTE